MWTELLAIVIAVAAVAAAAYEHGRQVERERCERAHRLDDAALEAARQRHPAGRAR